MSAIWEAISWTEETELRALNKNIKYKVQLLCKFLHLKGNLIVDDDLYILFSCCTYEVRNKILSFGRLTSTALLLT